jgi:hypothetical protein
MTYSLGTLPGDPTQERILLEVIDNPGGWREQVMFCVDVATVAPGTDIHCDGSDWFYAHCANDRFNRFPGEWPDVTYRGASSTSEERRARVEEEKANGTYRPTLRELLWEEETAEHRRAANREWMQKHRAATRTARSPQPCSHCGATFTPKRSTAQFCSTACRVAAHRARSAGSAD